VRSCRCAYRCLPFDHYLLSTSLACWNRHAHRQEQSKSGMTATSPEVKAPPHRTQLLQTAVRSLSPRVTTSIREILRKVPKSTSRWATQLIQWSIPMSQSWRSKYKAQDQRNQNTRKRQVSFFWKAFWVTVDNVEGGAEWVRDVRHATLPRTPFDYSNYSRGIVRHSMMSADLVSICPLDLQFVKALHSRVPTSSNQDLCRSNPRHFQISAFSKLHPSQYGRR